MRRFLLDTCVVSELVRREPELRVTEWLLRQHEDDLYLSVITLGELHRGAARHRDPQRRRKLLAWVERDLPERFSGRVLPVDAHVAILWGRTAGEAERRGEPLPAMDGLIAATATAHDLVCVTRNAADLARCGARTFDPWTQDQP